MQKGTITVLGHTVEYTADVVMDKEMLNEVHDAIHEQIISGEWMLTEHKGDTVEMFCDGDDDHPYTPVDVTWKISNPEAEKWKEIAGKLYQHLYHSTGVSPLSVIREYEQLIQEDGKETK